MKGGQKALSTRPGMWEPSVTAMYYHHPESLWTHRFCPFHSGCLYLLHAKLHLLVLYHQVTDVFDWQVPKQLDIIASDLIKKMCVGTSETKSQREKLHCTVIPKKKPGGWWACSKKHICYWQEIVSLLQKMEGREDRETVSREGMEKVTFQEITSSKMHFKEAICSPEPGKGFLALLDIKPEDPR